MKSSYNIAYIDFGEKIGQDSFCGIERKKCAQIRELGTIGNVKREKFSPKHQTSLLWRVCKRLPFFPSMLAYYYNPNEMDNTDIFYYRRDLIDRYAIKFFKEAKDRNPECLVILEIPTYPYDKELKGIKQLPFLYKERWNRKKLYKYVDKVATLTDDTAIFGIPAIKIRNGIDFTRIGLREVSCEEDKIIHAIFIGNFQFWHGLDRLIQGIKNYYKSGRVQRKFILHIVGALGELESDSTLATDIEDLSAAGYIKAYGKLNMRDVEDVYDKVSLAFGSLGIHRIHRGQANSSIKSREYGAKGLPIISGCLIDYIPEDYPYFLQVGEDDTSIDIAAVVAFHDNIYSKGYEEVAKEIREFAQERCSSAAMMKPIIDYCLEYFDH